MTIPVGQIMNAEIVVKGTMATGGSNTVNVASVYHYRRIANVVNADKAALEAAFQAAVGAKLLLAMNARFTQSFTSVRWINDPMDQALDFAEAGVGAVAGEPQSSLDAAYLLLRTGFKGKSFRGSKHYAPLSEADSTLGDTLNAAAIVRMTAIATALITPIVDATPNTWILQVYSRVLSQFVVLPSVVAYDVTQILVNKRIGRMKRREVKSVY